MAKVGHYELAAVIGEGGNAFVHRAVSRDGETAAVKLPKTKNRSSEPWRRFEAEIGILEELNGTPGVMPILASGRHPPAMWYAMPLAVPLKEALKGAGLEEIVGVFAGLAETLARLADQGVHHRDIKPENIFRLRSGEYVIGDFGIHKGPIEQDITPDGRRVGPALYAAQEMLSYRRGDDHSRADVHSLAKSLWVVATGQNLPLQGQHPVDFRGAWIGSFRRERDTAALDSIIVAATAIAVADRLTMAEFAQELRAWLAPQAAPSARALPDLSAMAGAVRDARRAASVRASQMERVRVEVAKGVEDGSKLFERLGEAFAALGPDVAVSQSFSTNSPDHVTRLLRHAPEGMRDGRGVYATNCFVNSTFTHGAPELLLQTYLGGFAVGDNVHLASGHALVQYDPRGWLARSHILFDRAEVVRSGSLRMPDVVRGLADDVLAKVPEAAELYVARLVEVASARASG